MGNVYHSVIPTDAIEIGKVEQYITIAFKDGRTIKTGMISTFRDDFGNYYIQIYSEETETEWIPSAKVFKLNDITSIQAILKVQGSILSQTQLINII